MAAVVTGAGSGVGRAIAVELSRRGLAVALLGRTEATLRATAEDIERTGASARVFVADVTEDATVRRVADAITSEWGPPQVVVNNAGVAGRRATIDDTTETEWDTVIGTNLTGVFLVTRAFLPAMKSAGRGRFVAIASISATLGTAKMAAYCASKWGVVGFAKSLAEELRGSGLQSMCILPGTVDTPMANVGGFVPQMSPADVARVAVFAALDAPDAMNGSAIECFGQESP